MAYLFLVLMVFNIFQPESQRKKLFDDFHKAYLKKDFKKLDYLLDKDFKYVDEYRTINKTEYLSFITGWSQVFETVWTVESVREEGNLILSVERDSNMFNDYFYDKGQREFLSYTFKNGKLIRLEGKETVDGKTDSIFKTRYSRFAQWVEVQFPSKIRYLNQLDKESATEIKLLLQLFLKTEQ